VRQIAAMLVALLDDGQRVTADALPQVVQRAAREIGARVAGIFLVDMEQRVLQPMPGADHLEAYAVDTTLAGRAYRSVTTMEAGEDGNRRLFVPLLDGTARLGVLEVQPLDTELPDQHSAELLAKLLAELLMTKRPYSDVIPRTRRRKDMRLAAEIQWELLPPLTADTPQVTISGILEPSYEIGGDAFDYAINSDVAHVLLVDAMGHGLDSSLISSLVVGAYRNRRRQGADLLATYKAMDQVVAERFGPDRFATAQLAELDCARGRLCWINAGHPPPVHIREGRVLGRLEHVPALPLGFGEDEPVVAELHLQPGDAVLLFTDGVVEARSPEGEFFGDDRLVGLLSKALQSGEAIPEVVRRLAHAVLDHHAGTLRDDATMLFLGWPGSRVPEP
jgi:serine phosphatase RsbU (regulator of sigma subunit)